MKYRYELHCHTAEVSSCARAKAADVAEFYAGAGYTGIFVTDHFICGGGSLAGDAWHERVEMQKTGYGIARDVGASLGLDVFFGFEYACAGLAGTDFLVYGLDFDWLDSHPELDTMRIRDALALFRAEGGFVVHAHPFREAGYIEMIRLLPANTDGVEVLNANRRDIENDAARQYAALYGFPMTAGSDNHLAGAQKRLCGISCDTRITAPEDLKGIITGGDYSMFDKSEV